MSDIIIRMRAVEALTKAAKLYENGRDAEARKQLMKALYASDLLAKRRKRVTDSALCGER